MIPTQLIFQALELVFNGTIAHCFEKRYKDKDITYINENKIVHQYFKHNFPKVYKRMKFVIPDSPVQLGLAMDIDNKISAFICFYDDTDKFCISFLDILETNKEDNTIQYTKEFKQYLEDGTMPRFVRFLNMNHPNNE